jgi:hypothetical protein
MSDGRRTTDDRRRVYATTVVSMASCLVVVLGVCVIRTWVSRNRVIGGHGYEGVVFNQAQAASILGPMLSADVDGFWTPTDTDILSLEEALAAAARVRNPEELRPLSEYRRQYFGYSQDGRHRILVIGFCDSNGLDWTQSFVSAGEGGCHFEATYDVTRKTVISLWALDLQD